MNHARCCILRRAVRIRNTSRRSECWQRTEFCSRSKNTAFCPHGIAGIVFGLVIDAKQLSSPELAKFIESHNQDGREVACLIGGPDGLPPEVIQAADMQWSFSRLTFPHDLAMVVLAETLYRASTIAAG
ncbi:MAG: 23S rRNA (pseudouridine(1915)-N(3))-methyltransferase RlmH, partial [Fuerstia sp.]|nr:23S rRNA (pseudouridine(1915)-N(3))-methyltransferase RlmH [Fuerstiella sp.]